MLASSEKFGGDSSGAGTASQTVPLPLPAHEGR